MWQRIKSLLRSDSYDVSLGDRGENAAAKYLRKQGFKILARGSRAKLGEIDIIAQDDDTLVFVEVKTRKSDQRGSPAEAVGPQKQQRLTRAALIFLKARGLLEHRCRFDVMALTWPDDARQPTIKHYQNAFEPPGVGQFFS